jgi:hypothetical protein
MRRSHTISVSIDCPFDDAYAYLSKPVNFDQWAAVEPGSFKPLDNGDWEGETPLGFRHFRFSAPNNYGVLDHAIFVPGAAPLYMPMRVVPNDEGTELTFTFFRREGMDDRQFSSVVEWIMTDFLTLKTLLEARHAKRDIHP